MTHYNRRSILQYTGLGASALLLSNGLSGCSTLPNRSDSYIHTVIKPHYISTVFFWTDIMLQAVRNMSVTPPPASRIFAISQLAGFLTLNGIEGKYNTPYQAVPAPVGTNPDVAYAVAFSRAIGEAMQTSFIFDRNRFLERYPDDEGKELGIKYGEYISNLVIKSRINDNAEPNKSNFYLGRYPKKDGVMAWSPTGPFYGAAWGPRMGNFNRGLVPGWGDVKPFGVETIKPYRASDFLDHRSEEFSRQYHEVKSLGNVHSTTRTKDQTEIAFFWEDGPRGVTPPGHWQIIAMNVIQDRGYSLLEQARLMALLSVSQADAGITTWDSKYHYDIVRPETAIRRRSDDFNNPKITGQGDYYWRSLVPTPDFPAYTSGHSCFSGASARMIANFIGTDQARFTQQSPDLVNWPAQLAGVKRSFTSLWQAAIENAMSRIYGGVHWDRDNSEGLRIGVQLADDIFQNFILIKS